MKVNRFFLCSVCCLLFAIAAAAPIPPAPSNQPVFRLGDRAVPDLSKVFKEKIEVMIPMRDGVRLHTEVYIPREATGPLPIILERTPYYANPNEEAYSSRLRFYTEFFQDNYIFALQDLRGRYLSEGKHVFLRPPRNKSVPGSIDESTDFYDTIDWLVKNVPNNNGRVGTLGISYGGFLATRAMIDPHPALKAVSPQATCADMFIGDDWHHNGAFRLEYSFNAMLVIETKLSPWEILNRRDNYEWYLDLGPLSKANEKYFHGQSPSWNAFIEHPNLDDYLIYEGNCAVLPYMDEVTVPALNVVGWFDTEDFYGPLKVYEKLEKKDHNNQNFLIIGPWYHGSWTFETAGRKLREFDFGSNTSEIFRQGVHRKWFAYWLKGEGDLDLPEALVFRTGANVWESFESWPPTKGIAERRLYLREGEGLSFEPLQTDDPEAFDSYISDPANPVPYLRRPVRYPWGWFTWTLEDQRFAHRRPDVLSWVSEPLEEDLTITGDIIAHLFASTSGGDTDWVVKLIDVHPESHENWELRGYQMMVAGEVFRARYRNSFRNPEPVVPDEVTPYEISLRVRSHTFLKGHRLMVQIQSSWFPMIDRNPQTWVPSIYEAKEADFQKARQRIYRSKRYPTYISLPVRVPSP